MSEESSKSPDNTAETVLSELAQALDRLEFPEHKTLEPTGQHPPLDLTELGRWMLRQPFVPNNATLALGEAYQREYGQVPRAAINRFCFADKLLGEWFANLPLDPVLVRLMQQWSPGLAAILVADPSFAVSHSHPLRQLLHLVVIHSFGWFEGLGRAGQKWQEYLQQVGTFLCSPEALDPMQQFSFLDQAEAFVQKEVARSQVLEGRVREAEIGTDRAWYYRQLISVRINQLYGKGPMPERIGQFLAGPWRDSMQLVLMEEGAESENWSRQCKLVETLLNALSAQDNGQAKHRLYEIAAGLVPALSKSLHCFKHNPQLASAWLDDIQELLMLRVKGQPVDMVQMEPLDIEPGFSMKSGGATDLGHSLIDKWYLNQRSGVRQKCIAYLPYREQILWVNYLGAKVGVESWAEVGEQLKNQSLLSFSASSGLSRLLENTAARFLRVHNLQETQRRQAEERQVARERLERMQREQARQKAAEEAERIERERQEQLRKREEERKAAEEAARAEQLAAEEQARLERLKKAREALDGLQLGGWMEIIDGNEPKRCKLAVRLNATDKLVFVDRIGLRVGEFKREELVNRILEGTARVLDTGADFDERLSRVVGTIRTDKR